MCKCADVQMKAARSSFKTKDDLVTSNIAAISVCCVALFIVQKHFD